MTEKGLGWWGWWHDRPRWAYATPTERAVMLAAHYPINEWPTDDRLVRELRAWYPVEAMARMVADGAPHWMDAENERAVDQFPRRRGE